MYYQYEAHFLSTTVSTLMRCESRIARFSIIHYNVMAFNASVILFHQPIQSNVH